MALLFMDSFDHYVTADIGEKWSSRTPDGTNSTAIHATAGRRGSGALRCVRTNNGTSLVTKTLAPSGTTVVVGVAVSASVAPIATYGDEVLNILNAGASQLFVRLNSDMTLSVCRGAFTGPTVLGTTTATLTVGAFAYLELKVLLSTSVGTVDLHLNGASVLSLTGQNTANTGTAAWTAIALNQVGDFAIASVITIDYDDLYVLDGSGSAPWNTFLGDVRVDARYPTAEGASSAWTPLSGSDNALMVDETAPNDDTDYNSSSTTGQTDTFVTQDAPVVGAAIYGIQHCLSMKKTDAGTCTVAPVIRHSGTDYPGADLSPSTSYAYGLQVAQTNPGTSAQWTEAGFNAAEFGYKRTA